MLDRLAGWSVCRWESGWMDGWIDGWMDGAVYDQTNCANSQHYKLYLHPYVNKDDPYLYGVSI